jgi:hypothetical protein
MEYRGRTMSTDTDVDFVALAHRLDLDHRRR